MTTRRAFLAAGASVAALTAADVFYVEPHWIEVTELDWPIADLPRSLEGLRIGHVTDVHVDGRISGRERNLISALAKARCNLVVMTGDMLNTADDMTALDDLAWGIGRTTQRVVATLGNWEHWAAIATADLRRMYARTGVTLLVNESLVADGLHLFATDDGYVGRPLPHLANKEKRDGQPSLLLTHSPGLLDSVPPFRFSAVLSGHTHGGQIRFGKSAPFVPPGSGRYVAGRYETPFGPAYVSRGIGMSLVPGRFACRPELPILTLRRA